MKNINYSIKKQFKISDEGVCLLPMLLRALCRLTKKTAVTTGRNLFQLLLVHRRGNHHTISPDGECKKDPDFFFV